MKMLNRSFLSPAVISALAAAILFGASTPIAKYFIGGNSPILIAGLLYSGSGIGLMLIKIILTRKQADLLLVFRLFRKCRRNNKKTCIRNRMT